MSEKQSKIVVFKTPGYTTIRDLGEGGSGFVKLARHDKRNEIVAIKYVRILDELGEAAEDRTKAVADNLALEKELAIVRKVEHANIVKWHETRIHDGYISIVMEYAPCGDLFDHVVSCGRLTEPRAQPIFAQLLSAVTYLHSCGIAHRDLKLENVFLGFNGHVLLGDFGMAESFDTSRPELGSPCGTLWYAAPELMNDESYDPIKADSWGLGCILYFMLTGSIPYHSQLGAPRDGCTFCEYFCFVLTTELKYPSQLGHEAVSLMEELLDVCTETRASPKAARRHVWLKGHREMMFPDVEKDNTGPDGVGAAERGDHETPNQTSSSDGHSSNSGTAATSPLSTDILATPHETPSPTPHRTPRLALSELLRLFPTEKDEDESEDGSECSNPEAGAGYGELPEATLDMLRRLSGIGTRRRSSREETEGPCIGLCLETPMSQSGRDINGDKATPQEDPRFSENPHTSFAVPFVQSIYTDEDTYCSICRLKTAHPVSGNTSITDSDKPRERAKRPLLLARSRSTHVDGSKKKVLDRYGLGHFARDFSRF